MRIKKAVKPERLEKKKKKKQEKLTKRNAERTGKDAGNDSEEEEEDEAIGKEHIEKYMGTGDIGQLDVNVILPTNILLFNCNECA